MASQSFNQGSDSAGGRRRTAGSTSGIEAGQNRPKANQSASTLTSQVQGVLDQQVVKGAKVVSNVTSEGLKQAARDVGETFSSALAGEELSTQSGRQAGKEAGPTTQRRQGQSGTGSTQASKSSGPTRSSGPTPSGGGR
jgi:hypothetical protein